jgi:hypothetical protein
MPGTSGALVDFAHGFSPLVEEVDGDTVVLDIAGCELLFGKPEAVARIIACRALEIGDSANVAVARNPDAAIHAARWLPGITVIPPGEESEYLSKIPLNSLYAKLAGIDSDRAAAILETVSLGCKTLEISRRFQPASRGADGIRLPKPVRGTGNRPLAVSGCVGIRKSRFTG